MWFLRCRALSGVMDAIGVRIRQLGGRLGADVVGRMLTARNVVRIVIVSVGPLISMRRISGYINGIARSDSGT